jgi:hypothetical protein
MPDSKIDYSLIICRIYEAKHLIQRSLCSAMENRQGSSMDGFFDLRPMLPSGASYVFSWSGV